MARISVLVMVFFVSMNAGAVMLDTTGTSEMLGIDAPQSGEVGSAGGMDGDRVPTGTTSEGSNFAMFNVLGNRLGGLLGALVPGFSLLIRAGVPPYIITFISSIMGLIVTLDTIAFMRGYDL